VQGQPSPAQNLIPETYAADFTGGQSDFTYSQMALAQSWRFYRVGTPFRLTARRR
jgi:hypothetical protein